MMTGRGRWAAVTAAVVLVLAGLLSGCARQRDLFIAITDVRFVPEASRSGASSTPVHGQGSSRVAPDTYVLPGGIPGRVEVWFSSNAIFSQCDLFFLGRSTVYPTLDTAAQRYVVSLPTGALVPDMPGYGSLQCIAEQPGYLPFADDFAVAVRAVGTLTVSETALDFGQLEEGTTSAPRTIMLSNTGSGPVTISRVQLLDGTPGWFAMTDPCTGQVLQSGGSCAITVTATPLSLGERRASIAITSATAVLPYELRLYVVGVAGSGTPALTTSSETIVMYGPSASPLPVMTLTNTGTGTARLRLSGLQLEGGQADAFLLVDPLDVTGTCLQLVSSGAGLAPGSSCQVWMRYLGTGEYPETALVVTSNASGSPLRIPVRGMPAP